MGGDNYEKLHIRLNVYDTVISVNINREDEEYYRKAEKLITTVVNSYASVYKGRKSEKEILYMALIDIALRYQKEAARNDTLPYSDILGQFTTEIEYALKGTND